MVSQCGFNLHFPEGKCCCTSLHMRVGLPYTFFGEMSMQVLHRFFRLDGSCFLCPSLSGWRGGGGESACWRRKQLGGPAVVHGALQAVKCSLASVPFFLVQTILIIAMHRSSRRNGLSSVYSGTRAAVSPCIKCFGFAPSACSYHPLVTYPLCPLPKGVGLWLIEVDSR